MTRTLDSQRHLFDVPDDVVYMNIAYISPLLRSVRSAGERAVSRKSSPWLLQPSDFFGETEDARTIFSRLVGARADEIALVPSATYGVTAAAMNLTLKARDEVLVQAEEFPSVYYPLKRVCDESGARIVIVARPDNGDWTSAILDAVNERTRAIAVTPAHWTDGTRVDCEAVGRRAREIGAVLIVDGCQSVGAQPFDVSRVQPDFLVVPTYKWMMGPYGYAFLYVSPRFHGGRPVEEYWANRMGAEDFTQLVNYRDAYQQGARRFDMGERSNLIALPMAIEAMRQILDWGPERLASSLGEITAEIAEVARARGFQVHAEPYRSRHLLGIRSGSGFPDELRRRFVERKIYVSFRGESMRIAPHMHITRRDLDTFLSELRL